MAAGTTAGKSSGDPAESEANDHRRAGAFVSVVDLEFAAAEYRHEACWGDDTIGETDVPALLSDVVPSTNDNEVVVGDVIVDHVGFFKGRQHIMTCKQGTGQMRNLQEHGDAMNPRYLRMFLLGAVATAPHRHARHGRRTRRHGQVTCAADAS